MKRGAPPLGFLLGPAVPSTGPVLRIYVASKDEQEFEFNWIDFPKFYRIWFGLT